MARIVDQINEMIDILEVIDPVAAASFRSRATATVSPNPDAGAQPSIVQPDSSQIKIVQPEVRDQNQVFVQPQIITTGGQATVSVAQPSTSAGQTVAADQRVAPATQQIQPNPLHLTMTADRLLDGIILAEVLGQPVSKRRRFGRR